MKKPVILILLASLITNVNGQNTSGSNNPEPVKISMQPEYWEFKSEKVEFITHKSIPALKILPEAGKVVLKNFDFTNGTIEFDIEVADYPFAGISFRRLNEMEEEWVYLRTDLAGVSNAMDALQYAPIVKGVALWDMFGEYQGPASFEKGNWNHIKLEVRDQQMAVFVNDMEHPALEIPYLEGNSSSGQIAFDGQAIFANLVITPDLNIRNRSQFVFDLTAHDPRYLRNWWVSEPVIFEGGRSVVARDLPNDSTKWIKISAERRGLVNLTRLFGADPDNQRRLVWLKTNIQSVANKKVKLDFGFSDEVWVILNGNYLYVDKNYYAAPIMKEPKGRCSIENTSFEIPLQEGDNEILVGVGNFFYGWGIMARLESLEGITIQ